MRPGSGLRACVVAAALLIDVAVASAAGLVIEQPRSFGHVLGDVLTQRILLDGADRRVELSSLPVADRVDAWFERRAPHVETDASGRRWLNLDYQIINAPRSLAALPLPALTLLPKSGVALEVAAWPVSVGPLTPEQVFDQGDLLAMRPDRSATLLLTAPLRSSLEAWTAALAITLVSWLAWLLWRNARDAQQLPFAHAWQQLKRLQRAGNEGSAEAWLALHAALNATAGHVVHASSLPRLFEGVPALKPLQSQLEAFYRASSERFFARTPAATPLSLIELGQALHRNEKRSR